MSKLSLLKKPELVELANELGVSADGFKADIEARILKFLSSNSEYGTNPKYAPYLAVSPTKRRATPASASGSLTPGPSGLSPKVAATPSTPSHSNNKPEDDDEEDDEDEDEPKESALKATLASAEEDLETLGGKFTEAAESAYDWVVDTTNSVTDALLNLTEDTRVQLSNIQLINALWVLFEFGLIARSLTAYKWTIPTNCAETKAIAHHLAPLGVWYSLSVVFPLFVAYFVNFTVPKPGSVPDTPARRTRAAAAATAKAPQYVPFDPLVFTLTRTLVAYLLYANPLNLLVVPAHCLCLARLVGEISKATVAIHGALGDLPYVTGVTSIVVTIYQAAL